MKKITLLPYYAKLAFTLVSLLCIGYIAVIAKDLLAPLVFSFLFAMLLLPVARFFERVLRLPRGAACMLAVVLFTAFVVMVGYVMSWQISNLADDWPKIQVQLDHVGYQIHRWLVNQFHIAVNQQIINAKKAVSDDGFSYLGSTFLSVTSMVLYVVFMFIYTFFILFYRKILISFLLKAFGDGSEVFVFDVSEQIQYIMRKYISGLFLEMLTVCAIVFGLLTLFGVKYALLLALITCIFNLIPYVGIFSAMAISTLLTLGTAGNTKAIEVAISIIGVHLIDSNVIMPRIVGSKVALNALIVVLGVVIGEMLWGISGMFLSVPVLAIVKIVFDRIDDLKPWGLLLGDQTDYTDLVVEKVAEKADSPEEVKQKAEKKDEV
jgi:predicted PurR-regulated permease PerM